MIEAFANQFAHGKQDARGTGRERIQLGNQRSALLLRHPSVQDEGRWHLRGQIPHDGIKVFGPLGQHEHLSALAERRSQRVSRGASPRTRAKTDPELFE